MGSLPSSELLCDALHRASPKPERFRHLQDTRTLRKLLSHLTFGRAVDLRPAELHALGDGALESCFYSLADHRPLKLSKGAHLSFTGESAKTPATIRPVPTKSTRSFTTA